jgi:PAS domain S-box-containing protein
MAFKRFAISEKLPYLCSIVGSLSEAKIKLDMERYDIVISDHSLGDGDGFDIIKLTKDIPVIIITGVGDEEVAVKAMKEGAYDYLVKDPEQNYLKTLPLTIENAIKNKMSERRFRMLSHALMSINDSVWMTDLNDNIIYVNEAFIGTYGFNKSEVIGKPITIIQSSNNNADIIDQIQMETLCGGWRGELINRKKDGNEFPVFLSTSVVYDQNEHPLALVGVVKDISEQKRIQEELVNAKEAAESANIAKSEFLANMSHEIRTPMNGIFGMTELALDTKLNSEQREYIEMVRQSAESLLTIINDILDFSKIEAGKLDLDPIEFSLCENMQNLIKTIGLRASQKGLGIAYYISPEVSDTLVGDPGRLRQIIINLISNAIKFTEKGQILLRIDREWEKEGQQCLHFQVTDTGIGISPKQHKDIFKSFKQADSPTTRKYGGTGLGLTISSQLVKMMGGKIWVESPVDSGFWNAQCGIKIKSFSPKSETRILDSELSSLPSEQSSPGSNFHFLAFFKLQNSQQNQAFSETIHNCSAVKEKQPLKIAETNQTTVMAVQHRLHILLAEDNMINQRLTARMLEKMNFRVTVVNDGKQAVEIFENNKYDLIFMDIQMPNMDGIEATAAIREREKNTNNHIPIIALTANAMKGDRERYLTAGMDGYLRKPINKQELIAAINEFIPHHSPVRQLQPI